MSPADAWIDAVRFDANGLITAVSQDAASGQVLTVAWMNREALLLTIAEQRAVYWSRSRQAIWRKGETSGQVQRLVEIRLDCDGDTLLLKVDLAGGVACHTGREHCFFRRLEGQEWIVAEEVRIAPDILYGKQPGVRS